MTIQLIRNDVYATKGDYYVAYIIYSQNYKHVTFYQLLTSTMNVILDTVVLILNSYCTLVGN